ncbi:MAG: RNA-binding S4 domain-containing protein [Peptococcaceae bacterium]|nr:RNA-binding S4 domain-containing protein [Peptococcaceae bacterium]
MRLDKYLKVSRIIKRRTVAKDVCDGGKVKINGKVAKAGAEIKIGDILEIGFGERKVRAEILGVKENVRAEDAKNMYRLLEGQEID